MGNGVCNDGGGSRVGGGSGGGVGNIVATTWSRAGVATWLSLDLASTLQLTYHVFTL